MSNISTCSSCKGTGGYHHKGCKGVCPACLAKRLHSKEEFDNFHPYSREGFDFDRKGDDLKGWTSSGAKELHEEDERRRNEVKVFKD